MFEGQRAMVVGGASGIGLETAKGLARRGADIWLIDRDADKLQRALAELRGVAPRTEQRIDGRDADASDGTRMQGIFAALEAEWNGLDILVHVAGISGRRWGDGP